MTVSGGTAGPAVAGGNPYDSVGMIALVARRLAWSIAILLLASIVLFVFVRATTGPLALIRGGLPNATRNRRLTSLPLAHTRIVRGWGRGVGVVRCSALATTSA